MQRVLLVDDSSTVRTVVSRQLADLGLEIDHAEHGEEGLAKIAATAYQLILLDVTMPVMDGPTMLQRMRGQGNTTPVIMLTSESRRSTVASAIRLGIDDYILKPFKADELRHKVRKTLGLPAAVAIAPGAGAGAGAEGEGETAGGSKFAVLVIDDMENVAKKLASLVPKHVQVTGCTTSVDAIAKCQEGAFRAIVIDLVIPGVNSLALMSQLRALQPSAVMIALALRGTHDAVADARAQGFADCLVKPFDPEALDDVMAKYLGAEAVSCAENVLTVAAFEGREDRVDRYYQRIKAACKEAFEAIASACFDDVIADFSSLPVRSDKLVRMVIELDREAKKLGLALRVVGAPELRKLLTSIADTAEVGVFDTVDEAREAA